MPSTSLHYASHHKFLHHLSHVVLHLGYFVIVKCVVCSFRFSKPFFFACDFDVILVLRNVCLCLFIYFAIDCPECEAEYYQSLEFNQQYQGKFTFDHSFNYLYFIYALSPLQ